MKNKFARHSVSQKIYFALVTFMVFVTIEGCGTSTKVPKTPETTSIPKEVPIDSTHQAAMPADSVKINK